MFLNSSSTDLSVYNCHKSKHARFITTGCCVIKTLLILPLCTFILYLGHQQWRQQRSFKAASHSDVFTYHLSAMELIWVIGAVCLLYGDYVSNLQFLQVGLYFVIIPFYGEMCFHVLTCVERYLAVVHPVTYLELRNARGVRIRNIVIVCVWLLCFVLMTIYANLNVHSANITSLGIMPFALIVTSFCNLSILCALIRPGPGEGGRGKERVDQLKLKAFHTITAISGMLWFWFIGILFASALAHSPLIDGNVACVVIAIVNWFNIPCCLVLPLLYLHRAGKLPCCFNPK